MHGASFLFLHHSRNLRTVTLPHYLPRLCPSGLKPQEMGSAAASKGIHILGIGNLGKYVAYALKKQCVQQPVTLLFHREGLLAEWEKAGRAIQCTSGNVPDSRGGFEAELLPPPANPEATGSASGGSIRSLIVATKTHATTAALNLVKHRLDGDSSILFLQNGMGKYLLHSCRDSCVRQGADALQVRRMRSREMFSQTRGAVRGTGPAFAVRASTAPPRSASSMPAGGHS